MTTITLNIKDDRKVEDVLRFLRDIDFLEISKSSSVKDRESSIISRLLLHPLVQNGFTPMSRVQIHER